MGNTWLANVSSSNDFLLRIASIIVFKILIIYLKWMLEAI
nr:MAG TPA: hypothetical protein [Caudoviricetes sp.]